MNEREEMKTHNVIVGLGVVFAILSIACSIIYDIQQKKGFISVCASVALPLGILAILAILWASRARSNNSN
jgi:hypothetical protein